MIDRALPLVAVLGTGSMATALTTLFVRAGAVVLVWGRDAEHAAWVVEDAMDEAAEPGAVPGGEARVATALAAAVSNADVIVTCVPWGAPLAQVLGDVSASLSGRTVLDVSNPYEMTALGPKLAMVVRAGSAGAQTAQLLPPGTHHVHAFTHVRADAVAEGARRGSVLPYVSGPGDDDAVLPLLAATGWVPRRVGDIADSALIEAGGPWEAARERAARGRPAH